MKGLVLAATILLMTPFVAIGFVVAMAIIGTLLSMRGIKATMEWVLS